MKLGFIGCGNMAGAIIRGIIASGVVAPDEIIGADLSEQAREKISRESGILVTADNEEVVRKAQIVFLTVKPQYLEQVIFGIRGCASREQLFVSIAAGRSVSWIEERFGEYPVRLVRLMPNTPALVGEGMTAACANCSSKRWRTRQSWAGCPVPWPINSLPRQCSAVLKWSWRPGNIRESSRIWSLPRQERRSRQSVSLRKKDSGARYLSA